MLHYWFVVFICALKHTFEFIGKSKGGLIFDVCVVSLTVVRHARKYGWRNKGTEAWNAIVEGIIIAFAAGMIVFLWKFVNTPLEIQNDANQRTLKEQESAMRARSDLTACQGALTTQIVKADLLSEQKDAQQLTIDAQQSQLNSQQGTMNSCVVNLGKMNPLINTKVEVAVMQVASSVTPPKFGLGSPTTTYFSAIVLSTNRRLPVSRKLKCSYPFTANAPQMTKRESSTGMFGTGRSEPISDREYALTNVDTGGVWDATNPVYLVATSTEKIGPCTFTLPQ
jgi:hypothetical protein